LDASDANTWIEVSAGAVANNVAVFREMAGPSRALMAVVKSNAYGHGMLEVAEIALGAGANWLGVFSAVEGLALRDRGVTAPILVFGPVPEAALDRALAAGLRLTAASPAAAAAIAARPAARGARVHVKVETGTNRQGMLAGELPAAIRLLTAAGAVVEGAYTHFADIEDTTEHTFAEKQKARFCEVLDALRASGVDVPMPHTACTAATILFPETHHALVRAGIGLYGLWPSKETNVSANALGRNRIGLKPAMTWKTRIAQIKCVVAGDYVGYGRTFRTTRSTLLAVLPVGYADGYDRGLSNAARTIVRGVRAPVVGRVCMNMTMIDVSDVPGATEGDEVVLLGAQGDESVTAEDLARLAGTINYEIVTRAAPGSPRIVVE
jgi:alanine racemase